MMLYVLSQEFNVKKRKWASLHILVIKEALEVRKELPVIKEALEVKKELSFRIELHLPLNFLCKVILKMRLASLL